MDEMTEAKLIALVQSQGTAEDSVRLIARLMARHSITDLGLRPIDGVKSEAKVRQRGQQFPWHLTVDVDSRSASQAN